MNDIDTLQPKVQKALNRVGIYVDGKLLGENLDIIKAELLRLAKNRNTTTIWFHRMA